MFTILPHTADARLRVEAADLETLFAEAGRGLFSLIVANLDGVEPRKMKEFVIDGENVEYLLFDWLSELLFVFESEHLLLSEFNVSVGPHGLKATAAGEPVDRVRHQMEHEIKAITYHELMVERTALGWAAEVIVDI
jgi:SHS2 domain-containing protein